MSDASDLMYCRRILPRVSRTFAMNIRVLDGRLGDAVRIGYLLCRAADTIEDAWPAGNIESSFERFGRALEGDRDAAGDLAVEAQRIGTTSELDLVAHLPVVLRVLSSLPAGHREAVMDGVRTLSSGMARYASRAASRAKDLAYLDTEEELSDYCFVVAGCVGVMLTRLYAAEYGPGDAEVQARRLDLAPVVGEALQLTNILLDWPVDVRRGRCYLPAAWLSEAGITPSDLVDQKRPEALTLARRLEARAMAALRRVPEYVDSIPARHRRYRLFCIWPALWAIGSLQRARMDPSFPWGPRRPKLPRFQVYRAALGSLLAPDPGGTLRRSSAALAP